MEQTVRQLLNALDYALRLEAGNNRFGNTDKNEHIAKDDEIRDYNKMPHDIIRDALEQELDFIQSKIERLLGRQAAREIFARRASALGEGAPDPGMVAREVTAPSPDPQLSEAELAEFRAHAAANPWDKRVCWPSHHIQATFEKWLGRGLKRAHITALQGTTLGRAYATEIRRHPDRRVEGLLEEPYRLAPGTPRPMSARLIAELSEEEKQDQRRRNVEKQRRFRLRHPKNG